MAGKGQSVTPEQMADLIRQGIRERVLLPGQPLIQDDLAKRFGVSRNPVREALRMLSAEGLVTISPGEGASVTRLRSEEVAELYDLRLTIEPGLCDAIVAQARAADVTELGGLVDEMDQATDISRWLRLNYRFHLALYRLASRPHTERILAGLLGLVQPYSLVNVEQLGGRSQANTEHRDMVAAIRDSDAESLAGLIRTHLSSARDQLLAHYRSAPHDVDATDDPMSLLRGLGT